VSQDPKDGGEYRTLNQALAKAEPWATIRVLDKATYSEHLVLNDPRKHQGICLEAPRRATLELTADFAIVVAIRDVPHVRLDGFRMRDANGERGSTFVAIEGHAPGCVLRSLDIRSQNLLFSITVSKIRIEPHEDPLVISQCAIDNKGEGIIVSGPPTITEGFKPCRGIVIRQNRVNRVHRGILVQGAVEQIQVTGNLVWRCKQAALQVQDLAPESKQILFANNSAIDTPFAFRNWDNAPFKKLRPGQVELSNNLLLDASGGDMTYILSEPGTTERPGDKSALIQQWLFCHNWRDFSGSRSDLIIPLAWGDKKFDSIDLKSRDPEHKDFMRPVPKSPLATAGAGCADPSLPVYVGAIPPKGVKTWDWEKTWTDRSRKTAAPTAKDRDRNLAGKKGKDNP
jgi:hypothetical protein